MKATLLIFSFMSTFFFVGEAFAVNFCRIKSTAEKTPSCRGQSGTCYKYYRESSSKCKGRTANYCRRSWFHPFVSCSELDRPKPSAKRTAPSKSSGKVCTGVPMGSPIKNGQTNNRLYGVYRHPIHGGRRMHHGWDYPGSKNPNRSIIAVAGGKVSCRWAGGYGKLVTITHRNGLSTRYAHLSSYQNCGKTVKAGTKIGVMGSTGDSTGPHLHFEVRCGKNSVDPKNYVNKGFSRPQSSGKKFKLFNIDR